MKRLFDIVVATVILVLFSPFIFLIYIKVTKEFGKPVFFYQSRPGLNGVVFKIMKFRSMRDAFDKNDKLLPDCQRVSSFGLNLRSSSLDELPSLLNVIKGDMSLVGPRPLLKEYLPLYNDRQALRHKVKPGITGWAQVNGRNSISWEEKFELDAWYVENQSFWLDVKILLLTIKKVCLKEDISAEGHVTIEPFKGNSND